MLLNVGEKSFFFYKMGKVRTDVFISQVGERSNVQILLISIITQHQSKWHLTKISKRKSNVHSNHKKNNNSNVGSARK